MFVDINSFYSNISLYLKVIGARHSSMDASADNSFEPFYADESDGGGILSRYSDASRYSKTASYSFHPNHVYIMIKTVIMDCNAMYSTPIPM